MRKRIIGEANEGALPGEDQDWLDLEHLAQAELTSEDPEYPIESALTMRGGPGWRAQHAGQQTIRLLFDKPQDIKRINLVFQENERARTQEFSLYWCADSAASRREIVRQQYNFSPPDIDRECEDYAVNLDGLTLLELNIIPDISGGDARASLAQLRLA
jgi:hypothetical protein